MEPEPVPPPPPTLSVPYEQIQQMVASEFTIEEGFIEYDTPTFYVTQQPTLKQAFMRLYRQFDSKQLIPVLRKRGDRIMLQVVSKPPIKPGNPLINIVLLIATIGTTLFTGFLLSGDAIDPFIGAVMFSIAIMSILGAHEMGHKLTANRHGIDATYPYFIPGIPPIGTFGAVIQQKSLAPNRDALFDLGFSGPIIGFILAVVVSIIGIPMSTVRIVQELPMGTITPPILLDFLVNSLLKLPTASPSDILLIELHPVAYAGYIGMVVTMLNLMPVGQLDGGHVAQVLLGERTRTIVGIVAIVSLLFVAWPMALLAYFLSRVRHPDALDAVSPVSRTRKFASVILIVVFVLSVAPLASLFF
jgi:membrane-associated protease RseP (regulator of RpoE activity)